jgi:NADPH:quinone reductase-like Zn-dependent oxidoreductase
MRAAVRDRYGGPEVVHIEDVEKPVPGERDLLVRVHAASVNRADLDGLLPRPGFTRLFLGLRRPRVRRIGIDVAGVVEAVGPAVSRFRPGDRVFADLFSVGQGAFAEYVSAPEKAFEAIPTTMTFEDAATLPHSAVLALQGLRLRNGETIRPGYDVLIEGASGNVGPFAVQIAKSMGATVTGVCTTQKVEFVRSLGADHVIDYTMVDYRTSGQRYDWILSAEPHHSLFSYRPALKPGGVYLTLGAPSTRAFFALLFGTLLSKATKHRMGLMLWWKPFHPPDVATLADLIATGKLRPAIDRRYPLGEVVEALRHVDDGHAKGKVMIITREAGDSQGSTALAADRHWPRETPLTGGQGP